MTNLWRLLKQILIISGLFCVAVFIYNHFLFNFAWRVFIMRGLGETIIPLVIISLITLSLYTLGWIVINRHLPKKIVTSFYLLYGLSLIYLLFLKNIGIQGYELNPLSFIHDFQYSPFVVIMNVLMFVPAGLLFKFRWSTLIYFIVLMTLSESCQYLFKLGFFDSGDIILNTLGFLGGNLIRQVPAAQQFYWRLRSAHDDKKN